MRIFLVPLLVIFGLMLGRIGVDGVQRSKGVDKCHWKDGVGVKVGKCLKRVNCSAAISNYKAGTPLQECRHKLDGKTTYCCPTEKRVSEIKCEEYTKQRLKLLRESSSGKSHKKTGSEKVQRRGRIVAGRNAAQDEFPFMVALTVGDPKDKQWPCGGTIISERFVLTAAHCVITRTGRLRIKPLKVLVGDVYLKHANRPYPYVTVKDVYVHPGYNHTLVYDDIALLELDVVLNITKSQGPACLPSPYKRLDLDTTFQATGWGYLKYNGRRPNNLQVATVPRMNHTTCVKVFSDDKKLSRGISRAQFCAGHQDGDTCTGDSGGPLIATRVDAKATKYYIVGVTSYGTVLCGSKPGLYINVQSYLNWIENIIWNTDGVILSGRNNLYIREY